MAILLKTAGQWDYPETPFDDKPDALDFVTERGDLPGLDTTYWTNN